MPYLLNQFSSFFTGEHTRRCLGRQKSLYALPQDFSLCVGQMLGFGAVEEVLYNLAITLEQFEVDHAVLVKVRPELNCDGRLKELPGKRLAKYPPVVTIVL